jgi:hypothetical protein
MLVVLLVDEVDVEVVLLVDEVDVDEVDVEVVLLVDEVVVEVEGFLDIIKATDTPTTITIIKITTKMLLEIDL